MERDRQHRPHRRSEPDPDGSQRPERSLCKVQTGEPEIQEQGMFLCNVYLRFWRAFEGSSVCVCVYTDSAKDPESTVEGAVWPSSVWGEWWSAGDHCVGQRHWEEGWFHWTVSHMIIIMIKKFIAISKASEGRRTLSSSPAQRNTSEGPLRWLLYVSRGFLTFLHSSTALVYLWVVTWVVCVALAASWTSPPWLRSTRITWSCRWRRPEGSWCCWSRSLPRLTCPSLTCPSRRWTTLRSEGRYWIDMCAWWIAPLLIENWQKGHVWLCLSPDSLC